jgi:hypothetical protein
MLKQTTMKNKSIYIPVLLAILIVITGCKKFLNINSDPDTTQTPSPGSVLPQCLSAMASALQSDGGLYVAKYIQNWLTADAVNNMEGVDIDRQGYTWSGGVMASTWNMTYFSMGKNINYIIERGLAQKEYQFAAVATALKAWSFQHTTDYNSDIIFHDAFRTDTYTFSYDTQETVYRGVDSLCRLSLSYLDSVEDASLATSKLALGDFVYNGDLNKWKKFIYGILARNWHHLTNKSTYNADSVIKYCNNAMLGVADDFCIPFDATINNNANYFGTFRDNVGSWRTSNYIVRLLDGTTLIGNNAPENRDPRLSYMLSASQDTTNGNGGYRAIDPGQGDPYYSLSGTYTSGTDNWKNARKRVATFWGDSVYVNPSAAVFNNNTGKYLFQNKAVFPIMTYSEMQFIKAEAALRKGDKGMAYTAYKNGINGHFDFINRSYSNIRSAVNLYANASIPAAARNKYLASRNVSQTADTLTMSDVMLQKYIALWGWGFFETWVDLRRFDYTGLDEVTNTGQQVYLGFTFPNFSSDNNKNPVQRVRPHFTSEYTYNYQELERVGALTKFYHTKKMWFSEKQ